MISSITGSIISTGSSKGLVTLVFLALIGLSISGFAGDTGAVSASFFCIIIYSVSIIFIQLNQKLFRY
ncbi:hypothetical protein FNW10_15680 [Flavobacterium gawalongense]|uniref:Uncharacterized protein n=1 Tax=Flavobacterium gawalongense TaxID=2594432 RepID=A0A553BBY8_9FLAO|nr:hypothetical protein FNW33_16170 [Flavobacterium gawalongense]TRX02535.1 hypothetical protein FNW12_16105 [Flavobacterium gawalongense]TRX05748.1 hypothetical protein FNW11_15720 [Flavobacterium gawalongense]TRX06666.1 hypothetical protein FNW10_15680 [Flavobacterium gawalongense]TRX22379.1 hypothetical protein FNW38_15900 [Flavobacterium gawalongense]